MLEQIATVKILGLVGYAFLFFVLLRCKMPFVLKLHFGLYLLGLGFWQFTSVAVTLTKSPSAAILWYNLQFSGLALQSIIFFPLTRVFLRIERQRILTIIAYVICALTVGVGVLGKATAEVVVGKAGYYIPILGTTVYTVSIIAYFFWGLGVYNLVAGLRHEPLRLQRSRIGYTLVGAALVMIGVATNFTPLQAYPIDNSCALINALLVCYAVTRYRLIETGIALKRSLVILLFSVVNVGGYLVFSFLAALLLRPAEPWRVDLSGLAGFGVLIAILVLAGWRYFRVFFDRVTGKKSAGYDEVLEQFSLKVKSLLDVKELQKLIVHSAAESMGVDWGYLMFRDLAAQRYTVAGTYGQLPAGMSEFSLGVSDGFVQALKNLKSPLWEQELMLDPGLDYLRSTSEPVFLRTRTSVAIPIIQDEEVVAILGLGSGTSATLFSDEDMRFLSTLANVAASSLTVALNYQKVELQLSHQTLLFVLSESLVRHVGTDQAIHSSIAVLKSFLDLEECTLIDMDNPDGTRVYSTRELSDMGKSELVSITKSLAAGKGRQAAGELFFGSLEAARNSLFDFPNGGQSLLYLPLTRDEEWIGVLVLGKRDVEKRGKDTDTVFRALKAILSQGLIANRHISELRLLKEYNEKLLVSIGTSGEMLLITDPKGTILRMNSAAPALLGFTEQELIGKSIEGLVGQGSALSEKNPLERIFPSNVVKNREVDFITKSGNHVPALVSSANIWAGNTTQEIVVLARDLSQLREMEKGLLESEERYRSLFENVPDAVVTFDLDGQLIDINSAGRELLGILGQGSDRPSNLQRDFFSDPKNFYRLREKLAAEGNIRDYEMELKIPGGNETRVVLFSGGLGQATSDKGAAVHGIIHDVTEQRKLQRQLIQAQKMEAVGRLAGGIAHDFNNVLQVITGYSEVLKRELPEENLQYVAEITKAANRAATLTMQLLAFSRKQTLKTQVVDTKDLIRSMQKMLERVLGEDIELRTFVDPNTGNFLEDHGQMEQVLLNLAVNARDAMPSGGKLTLETSNRTFDEAYVRDHPGAKAGRYVRIAVSDTGVGMDQETLSHIYEPFFTTKERGKGTGLGLSTVYGIVKQSEGYITCDSELGRGTTFTIYLPLTLKEAGRPLVSESGTTAPEGTETILLVDDDSAVRTVARIALEKAGYVVIEASGGEEASAVVSERRIEPDLLVTDVVMPRMSGKELSLKLKEICPNIRVLYASGYIANVISYHGILEAGADFLQKPFRSIELLAKVREILDRP